MNISAQVLQTISKKYIPNIFSNFASFLKLTDTYKKQSKLLQAPESIIMVIKVWLTSSKKLLNQMKSNSYVSGFIQVFVADLFFSQKSAE